MRRRSIARLPFPTLVSDVRDIVYANWLVPADRVAGVVPPGVTIATRNGLTLLTVLTYRHGHFGPALAGPLRRLFPSPRQSNWRLYVDRIGGTPPPRATVLFIRNVFDSALYALGTRLMSDALPSHLAARFDLAVSGMGARVTLDGGDGSAPSLAFAAQRSTQAMPPAFVDWFGDKETALATICLQDAAIAAAQPDRLAEAWINLPIDLATVEPLTASSYTPGPLLSALGADTAPWCFAVPAVRFSVLGERLLPP